MLINSYSRKLKITFVAHRCFKNVVNNNLLLYFNNFVLDENKYNEKII